MQTQTASSNSPLLDNLQPPDVPLAMLQAFVAEQFGLSGTWKRLDGERDQNFRVTDPVGADWVLRLCNPHESSAIFDCQVKALEHIGRTDPSLPVPKVRRTKDDRSMGILAHGGLDHCVILLSFLPGEVIGTTQLPSEKLFDVGRLVARLAKAMRGFSHPAPVTRRLAWDHRRLGDLLPHVDILSQDKAAIARRVITRFIADTWPRIETLRSQVIHGDAHPYNTLMQHGNLSGVIDFGDLVHGALIQDLSNTIADFLFTDVDNKRILFEIVRGYQSLTPLEEDEINALVPLIEARLMMTPLILQLRANGGAPDAAYIDIGTRSFPLLAEIEADRTGFINTARRAATFPPLRTAPEPTPESLLQRRLAIMGTRPNMFYKTPLHLVKGDGVWLTTSDGRRYLDCYNNVPHVGHCHPYVTEAIHRQSRLLNTNTRYLSEQAIAYAERLSATLDPSLSSVVYVNSGSEANDIAWRMAKLWTGHSGGLAMEFAYHGITDAIDPFSPSNDMAHWNFPHMRVMPAPDDYRGPFTRGEQNLAERYADLADQPIRELQQAGYGVAAAMVDSAFMSNGIIEAPSGYLKRVVEKIHAAGGLFIADEVQSGFGRMGSAMWGHQHHGVVPDFVTIGKPAGNGHPIGVIVTRPEILDHFTRNAVFFSTFGGNNVSCAAGLAVLDVMRDEDLLENSRATGAYFKQRLLELKDKHALIGDVRGIGLAIGVELVLDRATLEPARNQTARIANLMRDEGVLIGTEGIHGNILKLRPPVVFKPDHVDITVAAMEKAILGL